MTTYSEICPSPSLDRHIECYWIGSSGTAQDGRVSTVLPDGCMDIIFNLGDLPSPGLDARPFSRGYVVGTMRRPAVVTTRGRVDLIGIRFRPGMLPALLRTRADELTDTFADLDLFWRDESLIDRLHGEGVPQRIRILEECLHARIARASGPHPAAANACRIIQRTCGRFTIDALQEASGLSARHLRRLFAESVGIGPKEACRIARFRSAVSRMTGSTTLAQVALDCGYVDQAHFTREFRSLAGVTPAVYRKRRA